MDVSILFKNYNALPRKMISIVYRFSCYNVQINTSNHRYFSGNNRVIKSMCFHTNDHFDVVASFKKVKKSKRNQLFLSV